MKKLKTNLIGATLILLIYIITITVMPSPNHISNDGIKLLIDYEKFRALAYEDSGGRWTIGYGHTGRDVHKGMKITRKRALTLLKKDLRTAEKGVTRLLKVKTSQKQYDALVILAFNIGVGNLSRSQLLRYHNNAQFEKSAHEFIQWSLVSKNLSRGLMRRRIDEKELYEDGYYSIYSLYNYLFNIDFKEKFNFLN